MLLLPRSWDRALCPAAGSGLLPHPHSANESQQSRCSSGWGWPGHSCHFLGGQGAGVDGCCSACSAGVCELGCAPPARQQRENFSSSLRTRGRTQNNTPPSSGFLHSPPPPQLGVGFLVLGWGILPGGGSPPAEPSASTLATWEGPSAGGARLRPPPGPQNRPWEHRLRPAPERTVASAQDSRANSQGGELSPQPSSRCRWTALWASPWDSQCPQPPSLAEPAPLSPPV